MRTLVYALIGIIVFALGAYLGYAKSVSIRTPRHIYPTTWQASVVKGNRNAASVSFPANEPGVIRTTLTEVFPNIHDVSVSNFGLRLTGPSRRRITFHARCSSPYTVQFSLVPNGKPGQKFESVNCDVTADWTTFTAEVDAPAEASPYSFIIFLGNNPGPLTFDLRPMIPDIQPVHESAP